ncbi:MAG: hypothetical protein ACFFD4_03195 [Candidatus Odinarchaeota archaeon]
MTETEEKKLSPLGIYAKLVDQLLGKKISTSNLKSSYPGSDFHPLESLKQLKNQLTQGDFSGEHSWQGFSKPISPVVAGSKKEKESALSGMSEPLTTITTPITPPRDESSRVITGREITKVTRIIRTKLDQYSSLDEAAFLEDTVESLSTAQAPEKTEKIQSSKSVKVVPVTESKKEETEKDLENLFDEALSDLSELFEKRKKRR